MKNKRLAVSLCSLAVASLMGAAKAQPIEPEAALNFEEVELSAIQYHQKMTRTSADSLIVKFKEGSELKAVAKKMGLYPPMLESKTGNGKTRVVDESKLRRMVIGEVSRKLGHNMHIKRSMSGKSHLISLKGHLRQQDVELLASKLSQSAAVEYAVPNYRRYPLAVPNDPRWSEQWHYHEAAGGINLPKALDITKGKGSVVAVIDTGIVSHSDLNGNVVPGYDFISDSNIANDGGGRDSDPTDTGDAVAANECGDNDAMGSSWHGSHVAGTVAAVTDNNNGIAGVAGEASILPVRVLGKCGGTDADILDAMRWSAGISVSGAPQNQTPAKVLNLSLGGSGACNSAWQSAINDIVNKGSVVVIASGNDGQNVKDFSPGNCQNVISVAANNRQGGRAAFSNYGAMIDISAPGGEYVRGQSNPKENNILSTIDKGSQGSEGETYGWYEGTSMATPHVAGVAALMLAENATLTPAQIEAKIKSSSRAFPSVSARQCTTSLCGEGILDAHAAVLAAKGGTTTPPTPPPTTQPSSYENTTNVSIADATTNWWWDVTPGSPAYSNIAVSKTGQGGTVEVYVDIKHRYASDLVVSVVAPNGKEFVLENQNYNLGRNIRKTYTLDASTIAQIQGTWKLKAQDHYEGDVGYIDAWKVTFK